MSKFNKETCLNVIYRYFHFFQRIVQIPSNIYKQLSECLLQKNDNVQATDKCEFWLPSIFFMCTKEMVVTGAKSRLYCMCVVTLLTSVGRLSPDSDIKWAKFQYMCSTELFTKRILWIFDILEINRIMLFCNLFIIIYYARKQQQHTDKHKKKITLKTHTHTVH